MTQVTDNMPRTVWFPTTVNPARAGFYEVKYGAYDRVPWALRLWSGAQWLDATGGTAMFGSTPDNIDYEWRGLASDPNI